jgi:ABC-type antimicrobial peptide transport system permease subunit
MTINMQNNQLEAMYNNMKINCVFADPKGNTDGIFITNTLIDVCISENYTLSQYIDDPLFKRSLKYRTEIGDALLIGVNSNRLDEELKDLPDSVFQRSDYVIFVNEHNTLKTGDTVNLIVRLGRAYKEIKFTIGGVYPGEENDTIYCSWNVICKLAVMLGGQISAESGSFTLVDNHKLTEFKSVANEYFDKVDVSGNNVSNHQSGIALIIQDNEFRTVTTATTQNINMLDALMPIFYMLSLGVGFFISFLLIRNRFKEFNLLRSIGLKPHFIILITLLEHTLPALIGISCGMILTCEVMGILFFLLYIIGAFTSLLLVFQKSVMKTRSD